MHLHLIQTQRMISCSMVCAIAFSPWKRSKRWRQAFVKRWHSYNMISQCDLSEEILPLRPFNIKSLQTQKDIARISLALLFIVASTLHFTSDVELKLIPPFLPWRREALYITGICELLG